MDAHHPYLPVAPYDTVYPGKIDAFNSAWYSKTFGEIMTLKREITEKEKNHLISQYDGEIAYLDFHVGELMARLKEQRLYEDSLIIITSDHGEAFGERNFMQHGFSVYQDQVYVPLIIKYPDIKKAHVNDELVNSVDLMPTVLDVLGYEIPVDIQGQSLLKLENMNKRPIISESFPGTFVIRWHERFDRFEKAIFLDGLKFIHSTAGKRELYDLSKDPDEEENLYSQTDNRAKKLETALNEWLKKTMSEAELAAPVELKKDALRRLRELGYIK